MSMDEPSGGVAATGAEVAPEVAAAAPETPAAEPAPLSEPAATPSEAPAAEVPAAEAPAEDAGSLVEGAPEPEAPSADAKPEGEAQPEAPAEPIAYEAFSYPEGITVDEEQLAPFTEALSKNGASQEFGQELIDLHTTQLQRYAEHLQQHQVDTFAKTREGWRNEFEANAGNQRDTILGDAKSAIMLAVPDEKERKALWDVMSFTGAGDHPRIINAFAALGAKLRERGAPPPTIPTNPARTGRPEDRRYGAASPR